MTCKVVDLRDSVVAMYISYCYAYLLVCYHRFVFATRHCILQLHDFETVPSGPFLHIKDQIKEFRATF